MAAVDFFLKLDGIDGESVSKGHEKWIEIQSFSWGVSNTSTIGSTGGAGTGKAAPADFTLQLPFSIASPSLFKKAVSGQSITEGTLSLARSGRQTSDFLKWKLSDILISSYQVEGSGDGPFDQISLKFMKIEVAYSTQNPDGTPGVTVSEGWDFLKEAGF